MADPTGQGSGSIGDVVTQLQGIVRQLSSGNQLLQTLITAIGNIKFPQNVLSYTVATLPSSPTIGMLAYVTDGTAALAWGATVTGGHSTKYLCWWNGANWTVVGE